MSVIVSKRSESSVQFVATARELVKYTTQKCLKLPKRLTFFISTDLVKTAQEIYKDAIYIKTLYQIEYINERIMLCEKCISRCEYITSMLDIVKIYSPELSEKNFTRWIEILDYEISLLKGLIKKDKERIQE